MDGLSKTCRVARTPGQTPGPICINHAPTAPAGAIELLKLLVQYNDPVDYKGENGQQ